MRNFKKSLRSVGRFIVVVLLIIITFSYAMFQGGFVSWFLFYSLIPFLLYSLLFSFTPINIKNVQRIIEPTKLRSGDTARVKISFQNKSWMPLIFVTIQENGIEKVNGKVNNIFFIGWKRNFEWTYELPNLERGELHFEGLQFKFTDFFGWMARYKIVDEVQKILVYPRITEIKFNRLEMHYDYGGVLSTFSTVKDTSIATGVREYQSGDRFSWIHWKSFAKNETLRTKEFENSQSQEIFLTIDRSANINFENVIELAASMLQSVIKNHKEISLLSFGNKREYFPNIKTEHQLNKVMQHLAVVKPDAKLKIDIVLMSELKNLSSSTLLLITGKFSNELKRFLLNSSRLTRGVICFVVVENEHLQDLGEKPLKIPNVKVIPITKEMFPNIFTEVMKP